MTKYNYFVKDSISIFSAYITEIVRRINSIYSTLENLYKEYGICSLKQLIDKVNPYSGETLHECFTSKVVSWKSSDKGFVYISDKFDIDGFEAKIAEDDICKLIADIKFGTINTIDSPYVEETDEVLKKVYSVLSEVCTNICDLTSLATDSFYSLHKYEYEDNEYIKSIDSLMFDCSTIIIYVCDQLRSFLWDFLKENNK